MSLVIALKWLLKDGEAVLVAADSKATLGPISREEKKVFPIFRAGTPIAIAGGAGNATLVKQGFRLAEKVLLDFAGERWKGRTPSFEQLEVAVQQLESLLISRFEDLRNRGVDVDFVMALGSVDLEGKASLYLFGANGLAEPVHDNPGFAVLGRGFFTGGNLLLRLIGYDPKESPYMDLGVLSAFLIDTLSEVDPSVGSFLGESWLMSMGKGTKAKKRVELGQLTVKALKEHKQTVGERKELVRHLWQLCDLVGDKAVSQKLEELEEKQGGN